jgi:hypothetical protein
MLVSNVVSLLTFASVLLSLGSSSPLLVCFVRPVLATCRRPQPPSPDHMSRDFLLSGNTDGSLQSVHNRFPSTKSLLAIIQLTFLVCPQDSTIVATLASPISSTFNSLTLLPWLASGYLIANAAFQPLSGKLTDIFSRQYGLVFSNVFFGVGTLICGLAGSAEVVVLGRVVAGIGGGGLTCITTYADTFLPFAFRC